MDPRIRRKLILRTIAKIIPVIVALFYLVIGTMVAGLEGFIKALYMVMLPLALIWFSEYFQHYKGSSMIFGGSTFKRINVSSPVGLLRFMGWILLLLPIVQGIIIVFRL